MVLLPEIYRVEAVAARAVELKLRKEEAYQLADAAADVLGPRAGQLSVPGHDLPMGNGITETRNWNNLLEQT